MLKWTALLLTTVLIFGCSSKEAKQNGREELKPGEIALETFFRNPTARNVVLSPNGQWLASLQPHNGRMNIFVRQVSAQEWTKLTTVTDRDISSLAWKNDQVLLFGKDFGGDENFHVFSANVNTKEVKDLTPYKDTRASGLDYLDDISETDVLITMNKRDAKVFDVYRINVMTGETTLILENDKNYGQYVIDHKGELRMAIATDGVNKTIYARAPGAKEFKKVTTLNFKESITPVVFDKNNKNVYALSNLNRDTAAVVEMNPMTGEVVKTLYKNPTYDISSLGYSKARKELTAATFYDAKANHHFFSPTIKQIYADLKPQITDGEINLSSSNKAEDLYVVATNRDRGGAVYYLYDVKTKKLDKLLDSTPWLDANALVEMKPIDYKSRDGLTINGYLFLPKNKEAKNLPVIVNPHGGPWARDHWGYHAESQFFANRGYAVLKMNFRGSTGYGKKFWKASFKQWGLKMQDDVTDGVQWLTKQGIADKDRVAIYGGSYGGYATLAGLAFTPELYRCGVDYVGVSNIFTLLETVPPYWIPMKQMFYEMVGNPEKEKELLKKASPLFSADKIKAPLFVAQGAKDPRVKKSESDQIVDALKKRGVDVPYLVKDNEGHGFRNEENRFEFYRQMEAFLGKHMNTSTTM